MLTVSTISLRLIPNIDLRDLSGSSLISHCSPSRADQSPETFLQILTITELWYQWFVSLKKSPNNCCHHTERESKISVSLVCRSFRLKWLSAMWIFVWNIFRFIYSHSHPKDIFSILTSSIEAKFVLGCRKFSKIQTRVKQVDCSNRKNVFDLILHL